MTGQIQIHLEEVGDFESVLRGKKEQLLEYANRGQDRLLRRGGGAKDITWYLVPEIKSLVVLVHVHTCDAMGANIVNTMCEKLSTFMPELFPGSRLGLRILTNLTDRRMAFAECTIPPEAFVSSTGQDGEYVIDRIVEAWQFARYDTYRAATHNKGVMNGIDPVLIATGNDWRAIEAGAHAYCSRDGSYKPMTTWRKTRDASLHGIIELPMAVGTVGGVTKLHPTAQAALKLLGEPSAQELSELACAVGLAQNLSALRALATEGIQHGHMGLHQKNIDLIKKQGMGAR
jgi:hydroxymethylglutaryl-CoA reductase